jgi:8-oxo-dGTP diphosphatase
MSYRAAVLLLQDDQIALIERHRADKLYFTFPGGHVEPGETPEAAAVREADEELGLQVVIKKWLAKMAWQGHWQYYYLVDKVGGKFGTGSGEELVAPPPEKGTYQPVWMPIASLLDQPVLPSEIATLVIRWSREGWPEQPVVIPGPI